MLMSLFLQAEKKNSLGVVLSTNILSLYMAFVSLDFDKIECSLMLGSVKCLIFSWLDVIAEH